MGMEHVTRAHEEMFCSPRIAAIRCGRLVVNRATFRILGYLSQLILNFKSCRAIFSVYVSFISAFLCLVVFEIILVAPDRLMMSHSSATFLLQVLLRLREALPEIHRLLLPQVSDRRMLFIGKKRALMHVSRIRLRARDFLLCHYPAFYICGMGSRVLVA